MKVPDSKVQQGLEEDGESTLHEEAGSLATNGSRHIQTTTTTIAQRERQSAIAHFIFCASSVECTVRSLHTRRISRRMLVSVEVKRGVAGVADEK